MEYSSQSLAAKSWMAYILMITAILRILFIFISEIASCSEWLYYTVSNLLVEYGIKFFVGARHWMVDAELSSWVRSR